MTDCHCEHGIDIREAICQKCGFGELDYATCFMCDGLKTIQVSDGISSAKVPCPECSPAKGVE
jgi:hypothetical protein